MKLKLTIFTLSALSLFGVFSAGNAQAATQVYYSVGQNTTDHKTGSPTVTVAGTTATFSVAQTATNMGVGDLVTYTGGTCYISSKTSTTVWSCVSVTGGTPTAASAGTAVTSIAHVFSSLSAAVTGASGASYLNTSDLVAGNYQLNIPCYYDTGADTTAVTVYNYTTGANNTIKIYTPNNISTEVNLSQRHFGKWDATKYTLAKTDVIPLIILKSDVIVDGLQVDAILSVDGTVSGINANSQSNGTITISNSIIRCTGSQNASGGIEQGAAFNSPVLKIFNNVIYGFNRTGSANGPIRINFSGVTAYIYNNTLKDGYYNLFVQAGTVVAKNNILNNAANSAATGTFAAGTDYNVTNRSSIGYTVTGGGNTHDKVSQTFSFVDSANKDFHLASTDTSAKGAGINLSNDANLPFSTDIDNQTRGATWDIGVDQITPAQVYYSVGQSASNLMSGTPTLTITAGAGVFSAAQTANIGVGDRVTYNTNQIAYISAKTNADSAHWSLVTATGGVPADISNSTVVSITHEFTSLSAAVTAASNASHLNNTDLVAANVVLNLPCYYDSGADTTAVTVSGYTTGASNYIKIYTPSNTSTEANNSQRHSGKWDDGKYSIYKTDGAVINTNLSHLVVEGIQFKGNGTGGFNHFGIYSDIIAGDVSGDVMVKSNILQGFRSGIASYRLSSAAKMYYYNNIIYNGEAAYGGIYFSSQSDNASFYAYNNTISNCGIGLQQVGGTERIYAKNNLIKSCTVAASGTFQAGTDYNITDNASMAYTVTGGGNTHDKVSQTVQFADAPNKDFHLSISDTSARNSGSDLSADANLPVTTDIDGQTRPTGASAVDIGADQSAIPVYYSVGQNTTDHKTGSPTVTLASGVAAFSVAQTATNMGVGDKVTYNGSTIAYISAKISTTQWKLITALGATPADVSGQTVNSIAHAFSSLSAAEAGAPALLGTSNLVMGNYQLNFPCYYDTGANTTAVTISGYVTSASNFIKIYTPKDISTEVNLSQRHSGKWDDTKFRFEYTSIASSDYAIYIQDSFVKIEGLQVKISDGGYNYSIAIGINSLSNANNKIEIVNNIVKGGIISNTGTYGIASYSWLSNMYVYNNIVYDFINGAAGIRTRGMGYVYNNTVYNSKIGYTSYDNSMIAKNNIANNNTTDYTNGFISSNNNISSDATSPNAAFRNKTVIFADAANKDFHLSSTDIAAKGAGVDLQHDANFAFDTDIDGQVRVNPWDIGADQFFDTVLQAQQSSPNLDAGLVGHWTFDGKDVAGNVAKDTSGNNNDGTIVGASKTIGKLGQALDFNGTSNAVGLVGIDVGTIHSASIWIDWKDQNDGVIIGKQGAGSIGYILYIDQTNLYYNSGGNTGSDFVTVSHGGLVAGQWNNLVIVRNGTSVIFYKNGAQLGAAQTLTTNTPINSIKALGSYNDGTFYSKMRLDDVRIYNRALSITEIGQLYHQGTDTIAASEASAGNKNGLVGYWSFDGKDISGTTANDLSGNGRNGTINGTTPPALGKIGQALHFGGQANYSFVDIGTASLGLTNAMSVSAWVKSDDPDGIGRIASKHGGGAYGWLLRLTGSNNAFEWAISTDGANWNNGTTAINSIRNGQWAYVVATYDGSNMRVFINGAENTSGSFPLAVTGDINNAPAPLQLGRDDYAGDYSELLGSLDEVRIYNRALSAGEVVSLYKTGRVEIRK